MNKLTVKSPFDGRMIKEVQMIDTEQGEKMLETAYQDVETLRDDLMQGTEHFFQKASG